MNILELIRSSTNGCHHHDTRLDSSVSLEVSTTPSYRTVGIEHDMPSHVLAGTNLALVMQATLDYRQ